MNKKKAMIITYYDAPNYGAFLQAYAMQEFLKERGVDSFICSHSANKPNLLTLLLDKRTNQEVVEYRNEIQKVIDREQERLHIMEDRNTFYDIAIIGSDEVWNVKNLTAIHLPLFFQPNKNAKKTIAYAACAGRCEVKHLKLIPYTSRLRKLDAISVRDSHTESLIKEFGCQNVVRTLDSTFLYNFNNELAERTIYGDYLLVYTYGLGQNESRIIKDFARDRKLLIVATGSKCDWADVNPLPSPFEWLSLIKYSAYVVTSTFHGSVFSIIFNKQFVTISNQSNKVKSLLEEMCLTFQLVTNCETLENKLTIGIDYNQISDIVEQRRKESVKFILSNF